MRCAAGHRVPPRAKFCPECGMALTPSGEMELRQVTALFCDLVGSTALSTRLDPEEFGELVQRFQERVGEVVTRYGGHVERYVGDGVLIEFGWPQAHGDDAERAVQSALEIVDAIESVDAPAALQARIGLHTGQVVVGEMGSAGRRETMALGETMNVAARLQQVAAPGNVVMSDATLRLVRGIFVTQELGPQALKGLTEPVAAHLVVQRSGVRSRFDVPGQKVTPLVGRRDELATALRCWERAAAGEGQALLVRGDPGIGKSRLVYELRRAISLAPHSWLEARCSSYTRHSAFAPAVQLLEQALLFAPGEATEERLAKVDTSLELAGLRDNETLALVAALLSLGAPPPGLSPERARRRTIEVLAAWVLQLAGLQPMVLFVEDLHWADASTLELFDELIGRACGVPLLVVGTARPELTHAWPHEHRMTTIALDALGESEVRELLAAVSRGRDLPEAVVERIVRDTDGVPLFAEELGAMVLESGQSGDLDELAIPTTLQDSLMARLDRLSAAKRVAQLAAVLGREFDHALIAEVADLAPDLLEHGLEQLVADGLLVRDGAPPDATYAFKHVLIQDAAYRSLLKRTRRAVHGRIADALGRRRAGATVPPELLARHCEAAGRVAEAIAHYRAAADHAARHSAHGEAIAHLHKAVELTAALPEDAARDSLEMDLQVALGSSIMATRGYADPEIATAYERAHELCTALGDDDQAGYPLIGLAIVAFNGGEVERGAQLAERALKVAERLADDALRVLAHVQVGMPRLWQGHRLEALEHADAATGLYDRTRHAWMAFRYGTDQGVAAHSLAGVTLARLGFADQALERMDRAVALAHQLANPFNVVFAVTFQSGVRMMRGEPEAQAALAEQVIAIAEEQAFTDFVGIGRMLRASARAAAGDDAGALAEFLDGMTLAASTGRRGGLPMFLAMLAQTQRVAGRLEDALGAVEAALTLSAQTGQAFWDGELLRIKGELLGDQDLLRRAVDVSHDQRDMLHALMAATSLSRLAPGAADGADAVLRPLFEWFTEGLDTPPLRAAAGLLAPEVSERR